MSDNEGFAKSWLEFEEEVGGRLLLHGSISEILAGYEKVGVTLASTLTFPTPDQSVTTKDLTIRPGLKVRIYTPQFYEGGKPVCVFYHGGGWAMGDLEGEDIQLRTVCRDAGIVIVSVDYRLAPQHPYPAPFDDCIFAYDWAIENATMLNTAPGAALTFGTSAGGNLALSVALKVIDEGRGQTLRGVVSVVPVTVAPDAVPERWRGSYTSYEEHAEHTINTKSAMKSFFDAYGGQGDDPYVSPLLHKRLKDIPRVYLAVAGQDTLRDDGRLLRRALDDAGQYPGYPHWFWAFPSKHLTEPIAEYDRNLKRGFDFVVASESEARGTMRLSMI
ncbi:arylacetamide deacetylase [Leptodontidium sp. MPI-SDFR-AT-0119]|nr:arylacetamide deacetylase [Leptodontidium sp. MPI-SDFR-AT-0119]